MAVPANTVQNFDRLANREDLTDDVFDITPTKTPVTSALGRTKAKDQNHEWQTDILKPPTDQNKKEVGDDATIEVAPPTSRLGNYTQIMDKTISVAGSQDAADTAGYNREFSYQTGKRAKELRRDMEMRVTSNNAKVAPAGGVPGEMAGFEAWQTNSSRGAGGADPAPLDANGFTNGSAGATDGTARAFSEQQLKEVMQKCAEEGGEPTLVTVGTSNKQTFSTFQGIAPLQRDVGAGTSQATIAGAADMYQSDFGDLRVRYNLFQRAQTALVIDPSMAKLAMYRPVSTHALAKTGDSRKAQMLTEFTLEMCSPKAHGVVADLTV